MTFTTSIDIRFADVDLAGIVYYPVVLHYCHVAFENFFTDHVGVPYPEMIGPPRHLGFPMVALETTFESPFRYGMRIDVEVAVLAVGTSSTRWRYRFTAPETDKRLLATSTNTTVAVDMRTFEKRVIPDDIRQAFERAKPESK